MKSIIATGTITLPTGAGTDYLPMMGGQYAYYAVEAYAQGPIPSAGRISDCRIDLTAAPGVGKSRVYTLRKNGADTGITVTISGTDTSGSDLVNSVDVAAGDLLCWSLVTSALSAASQGHISVRFNSSVTGESVLMGMMNNTNTGTAEYTGVAALAVVGTAEAWTQIIVPFAGTVKNLYVAMSSAPGVGKSRAYRVRKNGVDQDITCTVSNAAKTASDTTNTFAVAAGDVISISSTPSGTPASTLEHCSLTLVAAVNGQFLLSYAPSGGAAFSTNTTEYNTCHGAYKSWGAEASASQRMPEAIFKAIYVLLDGDVGAGHSVTFALRRNGVTTSLSVSVPYPAVRGNAAVDVGIIDGDAVATIKIPTTVLTARRATISYLCTLNPSVQQPGSEVRLYDGPFPTGKRKFLPNKQLAAYEWELIRGGYYGAATITLTDEFDSNIDPIGTDRVEIWLDNVLRYRGNVGTPERTLEVPEGKQITAYGLADRLNSILVNGGLGKNYLLPGGGDISLIAADLWERYIADTINNDDMVWDIQPVGYLVETLPLDGNCRDALDQLVELAGNQAVWGFDVDADGYDRFFFRPLDTSVRWKYQIGGRVQSYRHSPDYSEIRNAVHLTGGEAKFPNLLKNSSFEAPKMGDAGDGNLFTNGGFETGLDGSGWIRNPADGWERVDTAATTRTGTYSVKAADNGDELSQTVTIDGGHVFTVDFWARGEKLAAAAYQLDITFDVVGSFTYNGTVPQGPHYKNYSHTFTAPAGATSCTVKWTNDSAANLHLDDVSIYDMAGVRQDGWTVVDDGDASNAYTVDWMGTPAWHGAYCVKLNITAVDSYVRIQQTESAAISRDVIDQWQFSAYVYNPAVADAHCKLFFYVTKNDGSHRYEKSADLTLITGWNHVSLDAAAGWTAEGRDTTILAGIEFDDVGEYWIDACYVSQLDASALLPDYIVESTLVYDLDTDDSFIQIDADLPAAVKDSITEYGRREADESADMIVDLASAQNWAKGYFGLYAQPVESHTVDIADADDDLIEPDGKLKLLGQEYVEEAQVVSARYSIDGAGMLTVSVDLTTERPTFEGLLAKMTKQPARKASGVSGGGSGSASAGGATGHAQAHAMASADDHSAAEAADYGKFIRANAVTGAIEFAAIDLLTKQAHIANSTAGDVATLVTDFNTLLAALEAAGVLST